MHHLDGAGNVCVDSVHGAHFLHSVLIAHEFVGNWDAELQHFQLRVTSLLDVSVHVHFVVVCLVMLDYETFERSVLVALQLGEEVLARCVREHLLLQSQSLL